MSDCTHVIGPLSPIPPHDWCYLCGAIQVRGIGKWVLPENLDVAQAELNRLRAALLAARLRAEKASMRQDRDAAIARAEAAELRAEGWENTHNQVKAQWKEAVERAEKAERERDEARAKVEEWCQSYNALHDRFEERVEERDAARTEVARLRAALDSIQHASSGFERCTEVVGESLVALREQLGWINMRAREALGKNGNNDA